VFAGIPGDGFKLTNRGECTRVFAIYFYPPIDRAILAIYGETDFAAYMGIGESVNQAFPVRHIWGNRFRELLKILFAYFPKLHKLSSQRQTMRSAVLRGNNTRLAMKREG
jgi:hypothetical protein